MRIGFMVPLDLAFVNGGIKTQASQTINHLKKLGVEATLINPWEMINEHELDLVHVFHAGIQTLEGVKKCSEMGLKIVLSPVFFTRHSPSVIKRSMNVEKMFRNIAKGIRTDYSVKAEVCELADFIAPNTQAEAKLIRDGFGISESKISVIPNGVESRFAEAAPDTFHNIYSERDFILFAGQAGAPRKGLITLLKAASNLDQDLVIIGDLYDDEYGRTCKNIIENNGRYHHLPNLPHDSPLLASAYAASKVFVLPSLYETPGIAALEAALTGSEIVITEVGGTKEYFGDHAFYVKPYSTDSLQKALHLALKKVKGSDLKNHILQNYTWDRVAMATIEAYKKVLRIT